MSSKTVSGVAGRSMTEESRRSALDRQCRLRTHGEKSPWIDGGWR